MELADGLGAEARDAQEVDEPGRDLGLEPLVEGHAAGRRELGDLVADGRAHPGDPRRGAAAVRRDEVDRAAPDGVRRAVVRDGLEDELALDLEHVADLVEDPGEVAVGQLGGVVGHAPMVAATRPRPGSGRCAWPGRAPGPPARRGRRSARRRTRATATPTETVTAGRRSAVRSIARHRGAHPLADLERDRRPGIAQQHDELLAAVAGGHVVVADRADDRAADGAQDLVPGPVAVAVVERLEPVDVDHQHADRVLGPAAARQQARRTRRSSAGSGARSARPWRRGAPRCGATPRATCAKDASAAAPWSSRRVASRPRLGRAARQHDRAGHPVAGDQRHGQGVAEAVDAADAVGDAVGDGLRGGVGRRPGGGRAGRPEVEPARDPADA